MSDCWNLLKTHIKRGEKRIMRRLPFLHKKSGALPRNLKQLILSCNPLEKKVTGSLTSTLVGQQ